MGYRRCGGLCEIWWVIGDVVAYGRYCMIAYGIYCVLWEILWLMGDMMAYRRYGGLCEI